MMSDLKTASTNGGLMEAFECASTQVLEALREKVACVEGNSKLIQIQCYEAIAFSC